jgi:hypothetical protein
MESISIFSQSDTSRESEKSFNFPTPVNRRELSPERAMMVNFFSTGRIGKVRERRPSVLGNNVNPNF